MHVGFLGYWMAAAIPTPPINQAFLLSSCHKPFSNWPYSLSFKSNLIQTITDLGNFSLIHILRIRKIETVCILKTEEI